MKTVPEQLRTEASEKAVVNSIKKNNNFEQSVNEEDENVEDDETPAKKSKVEDVSDTTAEVPVQNSHPVVDKKIDLMKDGAEAEAKASKERQMVS